MPQVQLQPWRSSSRRRRVCPMPRMRSARSHLCADAGRAQAHAVLGLRSFTPRPAAVQRGPGAVPGLRAVAERGVRRGPPAAARGECVSVLQRRAAGVSTRTGLSLPPKRLALVCGRRGEVGRAQGRTRSFRVLTPAALFWLRLHRLVDDTVRQAEKSGSGVWSSRGGRACAGKDALLPRAYARGSVVGASARGADSSRRSIRPSTSPTTAHTNAAGMAIHASGTAMAARPLGTHAAIWSPPR